MLRTWLHERQGAPDEPLFPTRQGGAADPEGGRLAARQAHRHRDEQLPVAAGKRVTPHVLRHTNAMLLRAEKSTSSRSRCGSDTRAPSPTEIYLHADNTLKQQAIDRTAPTGTPPGRYQPPDSLLAFLDGL